MTIVVDSQSKSDKASGIPDLAYCSAPDDRTLWGQDILLKHLSTDNTLNEKLTDGRWIGMLRVKGIGRKWLTHALKKLKKKQNFNELSLRHLINQILSDGNPIRVIYIHGHWIDVNSIADLDKASAFAGTNHK